MRILCFPSDAGGGFGHISRCLCLAQEAKLRGHNCAFVINDKKYEEKIANDFSVFNSKESIVRKSVSVLKNRIAGLNPPATPIFTEISSLDYQVVRDGLISARKIKRKINQYLKIVRTFKPDVLVGDTNLLVWILSKIAAIPVVQIVRYASHPKTANLIWWKNEPESMSPPNSSALFNPLLQKSAIEPIQKAEDLLKGDLYIVPSIPEVEPIPKDQNTEHVGALTRSGQTDNIPAWFGQIDDHRPLVYVTMGGGAGLVGNNKLFSTIVEAFSDSAMQFVVSTTSKFTSPNIANLPKNIQFFQWVPGKLLISKADLVVFHGGYGTMMECLAYGKPSLILPYHSEQEGNGKRLEQLESGRVIMLSREQFKRIEAKWKYGMFSFLVQNRYDLSARELSSAISEILTNKKYSNKAQELQSKIKAYGGAERAMDIIENL
jgi:UDP:flavonoid glycosyltransferase YjiC (YdhE family)